MTDTRAGVIPPDIIMLKSLHEIGTPAGRDQILANVASRAPEYDIEIAHADEHLKNLRLRGLIEAVSSDKYRVTSAGATELGPMAQTPAQPWDDEGRLHDGVPTVK